MWPNPQETEEILNEKFDFCAVGLREIIWNSQKQSSEVLYKKSVLKNFAKFTGKHLCQSLFSNKVTGLRTETLLKKRL